MAADLTAYVPRLLLQWEADQPDVRYRAIEGTLVFADVSGFTKLSERLARAGGKIGAEQMTDVINGLFGELLLVAAIRGGEMLKYGGDAVLLFFEGEDHALRGTAACWEMQRKLREIGRVDTGAGVVRLRMSVGANSGTFDFFKVGGSHEELIVAGPATTECVAMEAAADAGDILLSTTTAAWLQSTCLGREKEGGRLLRRLPNAPFMDSRSLEVDLDASKFLSISLRGHLSSGSVDPDHRLATVAFLHLMDMDRQLTVDGPEVVASRLDTTLRAVQVAFNEFGVSFLATDLAPDGTKVMAATGVPVSQADAEERMLRALVPLVAATTPLPIRAGVHRGHVFAGEVGPPFRRTFTTIGDVTNTAARVMGRAELGQCLVLQPVLGATTSSWDVERLEPFMAKGKTQPVQPFLVRRGATRGRRQRARTAFVGRDSDLDRLRQLWQRALGGEGGAVEIEGDAGVGKSALIGQFVDGVGSNRTVRSECSPYEAASPFKAVQPAFASLFGGTSLTDLEGTVRAAAPHLEPWIPLLALLIGELVRPTSEVEAVDLRRRTERLHQVTVDLLDALGDQPILMVVEDAEYADESSRALLRALAKAAAARPWLIVTARRPEGEPIIAEGDGGERLVLEPLSEETSIELVRRSTRAAMLPADAKGLIARSGGNPLFLSELLASDSASLPDTVEALFASKIDRLGHEARRTLRAAAVLGATFDLASLEAVLDEQLPDSMLSTELVDFVEVSETRVTFRHGLVRDVAYEGLPYRRRRDLHRRIAEWMLQQVEPEPEPELLAVHFDAAGAADEAWTWSLCAAERAERAMAHAIAAAFFGRAIHAARKVDAVDRTTLACVHRALGESAMFAGRLEEARGAFARARRLLSGSPAPLAEVQFLEGVLREHLGDRKGALRWYSSTVRLLDRCDATWERPFFLPQRYGDAEWLRTRVLLSRGLTRYRSGRLRPARRDAEAALSAARERTDLAGQAQAFSLLHLIFTALRLTQPEPFAEQAIVLFEKVGNQQELANLLNNVGMARHLNGEWDAGADYYEQSQRAQDAAGHVVNGAAVANNRAEILVDQGRLDAAQRLLTEAISTFDAAGHWFVIPAMLNLATVHGRAGRTADGYAVVEDALARARRLAATDLVVDALVRRAEMALLAGDHRSADAALTEAGPGGRSSFRGRRVAALLRARNGDWAVAKEILVELAHDADEAGERYERLLALRAMVPLLARAGEDTTAVQAESDELVALLGIVDVNLAFPVDLIA